MKINQVFTSNIRRTASGYALQGLFITHQLLKGLQVDEAILLGKDVENNQQQASNAESNKVDKVE